jgi:hypothetical protein
MVRAVEYVQRREHARGELCRDRERSLCGLGEIGST